MKLGAVGKVEKVEVKAVDRSVDKSKDSKRSRASKIFDDFNLDDDIAYAPNTQEVSSLK